MSTEKNDTALESVLEERAYAAPAAQPKPPMLWLLVPVLLLAVLAYLSHH
jgi:hypothetical protein